MRKVSSLFIVFLFLFSGGLAEDTDKLEQAGFEVTGTYEYQGESEVNITESETSYLIRIDESRVVFSQKIENLDTDRLFPGKYYIIEDSQGFAIHYIHGSGCTYFIESQDSDKLFLNGYLDDYMCSGDQQYYTIVALLIILIAALFGSIISKKVYIHYLMAHSSNIESRKEALIFLEAEEEVLEGNFIKSIRKLRGLKQYQSKTLN